jgi:hypothetical protein
MADRTRGEVDGLTDLKLVFLQRDSPDLERRLTCPSRAWLPERREYSSEICIAAKILVSPTFLAE